MLMRAYNFNKNKITRSFILIYFMLIYFISRDFIFIFIKITLPLKTPSQVCQV